MQNTFGKKKKLRFGWVVPTFPIFSVVTQDFFKSNKTKIKTDTNDRLPSCLIKKSRSLLSNDEQLSPEYFGPSQGIFKNKNSKNKNISF